jgi:hypothetical protein
MGFFRGLFTKKSDTLRGNAERLVPLANVFAISMFTPMLNQFPLLRHVKPEQWDVVITIAGVFIAATRLRYLKIDDAREEELMDIVASGLVQRNPNYGVRGFEDCKAMFERTFDGLSKAGHEPHFIASFGWFGTSLSDHLGMTKKNVSSYAPLARLSCTQFFPGGRMR